MFYLLLILWNTHLSTVDSNLVDIDILYDRKEYYSLDLTAGIIGVYFWKTCYIM